jgi:ferredoxin
VVVALDSSQGDEVASDARRNFEGDAMRIVVDLNLCQGHSQCEEVAPEIFQVREGDNGYQSVVVNANPDGKLHEKLEAAVRRCPTEALSLVD